MTGTLDARDAPSDTDTGGNALPMFIVMLVVAVVLTAVAGDVVAESVADGGETIVGLGGLVGFDTSTASTLLILTIFSATAALAWAAASAFARGRRLERRMAEELDERWDEQSRHNAGVEGRNKLLEYRVAELQTKLDDLSDKRDALVEEIRAVRKRTSELQNIAHEQRETIIRLSGEAGVEEPVVVIPDPNLVPDVEDIGSEDAAGGGGDLRHQEPAGSGAQAVERRVGVSDELHRLGF